MPRHLRRLAKWLLRSVVLGVACWFAAETAVKLSDQMVKPPLRGLENQLVDLAFQIRATHTGFANLTVDDVVIIDIDDVSIRELGRPQLWPRLYDARAIAHVASGRPAAIGIDYLYTESDSLLPVYADLLRRRDVPDAQLVLDAMSSDDTLAQVIQSTGVVYLALFDDDEPGDDSDPPAHELRLIKGAPGVLPSAPKLNALQLPVPSLREGAKAVGLISMPSQHDGTVRSYQLLSTTGEEQGASWLANFPFYMLTDALGLGDEELEVRDDGIHALNQLFVPLDQRASFRINWAGEQDPIRYISFFKVVHEMVPAEFFEGKFVFFGTSASGMQDLKTVPSRIDKMPGVEVHVHAFLTMANEAWIKEVSNREARPWFLIIAIILAGLMLVMRPLFGFVTTVVLTVAEMLAFVLYVLPERSMVFPIVSLMIITLLTHVFSALYIYFVRERNVRKLRNAFAAYVPKEVVRKIAADTRAVKLGGQRMHLTVLFSDIRGFTSYSESLAPEEVVSFLNDYLSRMSEAIFSNRGTIDKFIGDAVMAIFGAPISQRDHANRACSAGLDMVAALEAFNEVLRQEKKPPVAMGAGINTGDMTVGNIGSRQRFNYTVIGDSVNVAARLESLTKFFGVTLICSAATREACEPDHFVFRPLGRVRLQGRSGHTEIFELCGTADHVVLSYDSTEWSAIIDAVNARDLNGALHRLIVFRERHPNDLPSLRMYELCVLVRDTGDEPVFTPGK